jgi:hypothetical protein
MNIAFLAPGEQENPSALSVFRRSLFRRKEVFVSTVVATVVVNVIALATSLYSMQVYDRVIPRSGFATLWVLTVGIIFALLLDFGLRTTRALMIEREAAKIDSEVSEYFFARAQAIRLDARPPAIVPTPGGPAAGVGTGPQPAFLGVHFSPHRSAVRDLLHRRHQLARRSDRAGAAGLPADRAFVRAGLRPPDPG